MIGRSSASTMVGSRAVPPLATLRIASASWLALGHSVLEEVAIARRTLGKQGDCVLGIVVLGEHDDAGAWMALANFLGSVNAFAPERGRHPDVGHQDLRRDCLATGNHLVVVGGDADDLKIGAAVDQRANALADDQVVVREEDADGAPGRRRYAVHLISSRMTQVQVGQGAGASLRRGASTPGDARHHPGSPAEF